MKVMIATDGSLHAEKAARFFSHLPHRELLELLIVAVNYAPEIHGTVEVLGAVEQINANDKERLVKACETIAAMFDGAMAKVESLILDGHPGETLVDLAESRQIDLVVMGAVGHSTFDRLLLGSVSDFVATHTASSVLVVRNTLLDHLYDHELKICYAYDGSKRCRAALEDMSQFNWLPTMRVDLVNVIRLPQIYSDIPIPIDTTDLRAKAGLELEQGKIAARALTENIATHIRESDHVGDALVQFCKHNENNLLLIGDTGRGIMRRFLLGSVSRYVLREGSCSVWIGRSRV
jgi:nucleotide-binding universal stress UspA family protein